MLWQRLITGPLLIALILGIVWLDGSLDAKAAEHGLPPGLVLFALSSILSVLIARELVRFLRAASIQASMFAAIIAALSGLSAPPAARCSARRGSRPAPCHRRSY